MLGYSSGKLLFNEDGALSDSGSRLLSSRQDGVTLPATPNQVRTLLDKLVERGLVKRFNPYRGSLTYYGKFVGPESIAAMLIKRAERTSHNPKLVEAGQRLRALRGTPPLSGEALLSGEPSPHNEEPPHNEPSPHNEECTTQAPPDHHPSTTQAPHNASSNASSNASPNASHNAGEAVCEKGSSKATLEPPTLIEVEAFFAGLKKDGASQAGEWFEVFGQDVKWATEDWKRTASRWLFDNRRHKEVTTP